jgi:hypothetical protein
MFSLPKDTCMHVARMPTSPAMLVVCSLPMQPWLASPYPVCTEEERVLLRRQRAALRLLPELLLAGVHQDSGPLLGVVKQLVRYQASGVVFMLVLEVRFLRSPLLAACMAVCALVRVLSSVLLL